MKINFFLSLLACLSLPLASCNDRVNDSKDDSDTDQSSLKHCTITWLNADGSVLEVDKNVVEGSMPSYDGLTPTKQGDAQNIYTFSGWSPSISYVTQDTTYIAQYSTSAQLYTITWKNWDGTVLETDTDVPFGATPTYDGQTPIKEGDAQYSYSFDGWSPSISYVTQDATYIAKFTSSINKYTVTWKNWDGTVLEIDSKVAYGETPTYDGQTPIKEGDAQYSYQFEGWSPNIDQVTGDATYVATFSGTTNLYTITWKNWNGAVLETDTNVPFGATPTYDGQTPIKEGNTQYSYEFTGWSPNLGEVSGDTTYTAQFCANINKYDIIWKNWDGTVLETDLNVPYGHMPTFDGETPTRGNDDLYTYSWSGWSPQIHEVYGNEVYTATYNNERIKYTIDFDLNGGLSSSYKGPQQIIEFTKSAFFFDCVKNNYTFRGWSYNGTKIFDENGNQLTEVILVNGMTFVAEYSQTTVLTVVKNIDEAGTIIGAGEYPYQTYVDVSANVNQGYDFVGWYFEDTLLSQNKDYKYLMWNEDVVLEARFKLASFLLNIYSNNSDYGLVMFKEVNEYQQSQQKYYDYKTPVTIAAYSKTDVRFLGWYNSNNQLVETNAVYTFNMPNYDYTLEAKWDYFTITYNLYEGTNNKLNPLSYSKDMTTISLYEPTKTGYDFLGWEYNGNYITEINPNWMENITLNAVWDAHVYSINYELDGGTNDSLNPTSYTIENNIINLNPASKVGYTFDGWYLDDEFHNEITENYNAGYGDKTIYAKWVPIQYSILYNLNNGENSENNPSFYTIENSVILESPTREGYSFLGWYNDNDEKITEIPLGTTGALNFEAHWNEGNEYTITLNPNNGEVSIEQISVQFNHSYSLPIPTRLGYTFTGWFDGSTLISNSGNWTFASDKVFVAHWNEGNKYTLTLETNGGEIPSYSLIVQFDHSYSLPIPTRLGYTFTGWFDGSTLISNTGTWTFASDKLLITHWSANCNSLSVTSNDTSKGKVSIVSGSGYSDESITVAAIPNADCAFNGWYHESTKICNDSTYTFVMPTNDYSLVAHFITKAEEEHYKSLGVIPSLDENNLTITYGLYPQKHVNDSVLISSLNSLTTSESNGWYLYNGEYYARTRAITYNSNETFEDGNTIVNETMYWFKCEPIIWNILSNKDNEYLLLSSSILDTHCYHNSRSDRKIQNVTIYPNNYAFSDIRAWITNDFYNSAFTLGDDYIQTTIVQNFIAYSSYPLEQTTQDKIFLLDDDSYQKTSYGFVNSRDASDTRCSKTTDWAKAKGTYHLIASSVGTYWYRNRSDYSTYITGFIGLYGAFSADPVNTEGRGVRPSIALKIAS